MGAFLPINSKPHPQETDPLPPYARARLRQHGRVRIYAGALARACVRIVAGASIRALIRARGRV